MTRTNFKTIKNEIQETQYISEKIFHNKLISLFFYYSELRFSGKVEKLHYKFWLFQ